MVGKFRIAVVGSRDYPYAAEAVEAFFDTLFYHLRADDYVIVSGGARGIDSLAEVTARHNYIETLIFPAEWEKYGKSAGYIRNRDIVANADKVVAFWDGESKGTKHSIDLALEMKKNLEVRFPHV